MDARRSSALVASFVLLLLVVIPSGTAAAAAPPSTAEKAKEVTHCAFNIATGTQQCFGTFRESIGSLGGGVPEGVTENSRITIEIANAIEARSSQSRIAAASTLVAILYDNSGWSGSTQTVYSSAGGCDGDSGVEYQANIPLAFNDRTSSYDGFSSCNTVLYENTNYTGASVGNSSIIASSYVGNAMNDRASSAKWL